ncbi:MAG: GNAT family N-acetyltransferase [Archangium sp.]|nr:GNAT family N-acetyltransferase [Archangium sp.]
MSLTAPAPLDDSHELDEFRCAEPDLELWLKRRALRNQKDGASRTFVVCDGLRVVGYYALAAGSVLHAQAPGAVRRNMPEPIPVVVLGRLAVDAEWSGKGLGRGLLKDAVLRSLRLAEDLGVRALLSHAINAGAKAFSLHHGFVESPLDPLTVMLPLGKLKPR